MAKQRHTVEQIVSKLRQIEMELSQGRTVEERCRSLSVTESIYYRWRKAYSWLKTAVWPMSASTPSQLEVPRGERQHSRSPAEVSTGIREAIRTILQVDALEFLSKEVPISQVSAE